MKKNNLDLNVDEHIVNYIIIKQNYVVNKIISCIAELFMYDLELTYIKDNNTRAVF